MASRPTSELIGRAFGGPDDLANPLIELYDDWRPDKQGHDREDERQIQRAYSEQK